MRSGENLRWCRYGHERAGDNLGFNAANGGHFCKQCAKDRAKAIRDRTRKPKPTIEERFWAKVDKCGPIRKRSLGRCWLWTASVNRGGYGVFGSEPQKKAHRVAYELLVGPIPKKMELDHLCRDPECVRPTHMEPVTHAENMRRGLAARNGATRNVRCPKGHDLTIEANVYHYRPTRNAPPEYRCVICRDTPRPGTRRQKPVRSFVSG